MEFVDPVEITLKVIKGLYPGVTTVQLDNLAAETAAFYEPLKHPDYAVLWLPELLCPNLHKETKKTWSEVIEELYNMVNKETGTRTPMISDKHYEIIMKNADRLNSAIIYDRDFNYNFFGFKTLERSYLMKNNGRVVERPQHMLMRVAVGIHGEDIDAAIETYNLLSEKYFTHAADVMLRTHAMSRSPRFSSFSLYGVRRR
ncbi:ribonucleoside-diphosphate reductase large subunit-like [Diaphorina citri]|uniref:Ribonucleoside-diphosphate reductase large subunit-like n=1 Tax=Diaphorina citri TaxID=121845 RepID=A0A1S4EMJ7_DIACI|nr:ribonucleoside-diphosphate reductase large subunit-like [Diaphorina citri]